MGPRKAQISMNMIVYVAIALFVLVLVVAFATGGIGKGFRGITTAGPGELDTLKNRCQSACNQAKSTVDSSGTSAWGSSSYCTEQYTYDKNSDGTISEVNPDEIISCWESPISISCSKTVNTPEGAISLGDGNPSNFANIKCQEIF